MRYSDGSHRREGTAHCGVMCALRLACKARVVLKQITLRAFPPPFAAKSERRGQVTAHSEDVPVGSTWARRLSAATLEAGPFACMLRQNRS